MDILHGDSVFRVEPGTAPNYNKGSSIMTVMRMVEQTQLAADREWYLRNDLQCYARLLHLMAHYELGNDSIIDSLMRSVYRFMAKMKNFSIVEEEIFKFIRNSFNLSPKQLKPELEKFLEKIKHLEKNRFETRALSYLDVISWVESKVYQKPMSDIVYEKYQSSKHRMAAA